MKKYERREYDVMRILADPHPQNGADYAIQLYYKAHGHNPRFSVTYKHFDDDHPESDFETASLEIDGQKMTINIRTGKITPILSTPKIR